MTYLDATDGIECLTAGTDTYWEVVNNFLKCKYKIFDVLPTIIWVKLGKYSYDDLIDFKVTSGQT